MNEETGTYRALAYRYANLVERLEKLNRQATKLGVEPVSYTEISRETVKEKIWDEMAIMSWEVMRTYVTFTVEGGYPHLNGWEFLGIIEPTEGGNLLKAIPGKEVPEQYRDATNFCDHCKTDRYRLQTFVIRHEDGRTAQVGRNCLAKYVGSNATPARLAAMAEFEERIRSLSDDDEYWGSGSATYQIDGLEFLTWVASQARQHGFVTSKQAQESYSTATSREVYNLLTNRDAFKEFEKKVAAGKEEFPNEADAALALTAREWAKANTKDSTFDINMRIVAGLDAIDHKSMGILAYVIEAYRRSQETAKKEAREKAEKKPTRYLGAVGKRITLVNLTVDRVQHFESDYGVSTLVKFADSEGNTITWWASGSPSWPEQALDFDQPVSVAGTVKKHDDYKGEPQTVLTRVRPL